MSYDGENRPLDVTFAGATTSYGYGPDGARLLKAATYDTTLFAGAVEVRNYGTANEIVAFYPHEDYIASTSYNARGQVASMIYANGAWVFISFNASRGWMGQWSAMH